MKQYATIKDIEIKGLDYGDFQVLVFGVEEFRANDEDYPISDEQEAKTTAEMFLEEYNNKVDDEQLQAMVEKVKKGGLYDDLTLIECFMTSTMFKGFKGAYKQLWNQAEMGDRLKNHDFKENIKEEFDNLEFEEVIYEELDEHNLELLCDYLIPIFDKTYNIKGDE